MTNLSHDAKKIYLGLDVSQKTIEIFAVMGEESLSMGKIPNNSQSLGEFFDKVPAPTNAITVALETGTHSAWISRCLEERGIEVIVAHARDLAFIYKGAKKSDRIDAEKLARVARADKKLLHPVKLMDRKRQEALLAICHEEFAEPTRWSLLNAFTENAKKYSPGRADICHRGLTRLFGLDGNRSALWN